MQQVSFFGFARTSDMQAQALEVALAVSAHDINSDIDVSRRCDPISCASFQETFPPVEDGKMLSGLWRALHPNVSYNECEYREPSASSLRTDNGIIFYSDCGDVDSASRIVELIVQNQDYATIWWNDMDLPTGDVQPQVIRIGSAPPVPPRTSKLGEAVALSPVLDELGHLLTSHADMYDLAFSMAGICCQQSAEAHYARPSLL
jgi:hypothetical protein